MAKQWEAEPKTDRGHDIRMPKQLPSDKAPTEAASDGSPSCLIQLPNDSVGKIKPQLSSSLWPVSCSPYCRRSRFSSSHITTAVLDLKLLLANARTPESLPRPH